MRLTGNISLALAMLSWGSIIPFLSELSKHFDAYFLSSVRCIGAIPCLVFMLWLFERPSRIPSAYLTKNVLLKNVILGLGFALASCLYTIGIYLSDPVSASIMVALNPLIVAGSGWLLFGERRPSSGVFAAIFIGALGSLLANAETTQPAQISLAQALLIAASIIWAWYSVTVQKWFVGYSQLRITTLTAIPAGLILSGAYAAVVAAGYSVLPDTVPSRSDITLIAAVTISGAVVGPLLWNFGVKRLGVIKASSYLNLVPIFGIVIAIAFGYRPRIEQTFGMALVLCAVVLAQAYDHVGLKAASGSQESKRS